jgi:hypothetical protein
MSWDVGWGWGCEGGINSGNGVRLAGLLANMDTHGGGGQDLACPCLLMLVF